MMAYAVYGVVEKWQLLQMSASCAVRDDRAMQKPADLCRCLEESCALGEPSSFPPS
jgi:hypothetical protein